MVNVVNKIVMTMTGRLIHAAAPVSGRRRHTTFAEHGPLEPRPKQAQPPQGNAMRGSDTPCRALATGGREGRKRKQKRGKETTRAEHHRVTWTQHPPPASQHAAPATSQRAPSPAKRQKAREAPAAGPAAGQLAPPTIMNATLQPPAPTVGAAPAIARAAQPA